jgi:hypothetical protein
LDQAAIGDDILAPGEAGDLREVIAQHEAEQLADPGNGVQPRPGGGVMVSGGGDEGAFDIATPRIIGGDKRQIDGDTLVTTWRVI